MGQKAAPRNTVVLFLHRLSLHSGHLSASPDLNAMDPLSMTASIGSICSFTVKLIFSISEFIDSAQQAPTEVQSLSNELAALYAGFGHIRLAVQAPRVFELPDKWKDNFDGLMTDCETTLKEVQDLIDKAKITKPPVPQRSSGSLSSLFSKRSRWSSLGAGLFCKMASFKTSSPR
jgi:hypothetical protein